MQTRATAQLARKLRLAHEQTRSWAAAAQALEVLTSDGQPAKGLAYLIAMRGYEPARPETRARLGLGRKANPRLKLLHELPACILLWQFQNRSEF